MLYTAACARTHVSTHAAQLDPQGGKSPGRTAEEGARDGTPVFSSTTGSSCHCARCSHSDPHRDMAAAIVNTEAFNIQNLVLSGISPSWVVMRFPVPIRGEGRSCLCAAFLAYWSFHGLNLEETSKSQTFRHRDPGFAPSSQFVGVQRGAEFLSPLARGLLSSCGVVPEWPL